MRVPREPEIEQLGTLLGQEHVGRLQIPVNEPCLMECGENVHEREDHLGCFVTRHAAASDARRQRLAVQEFHHQERLAVVLVHLVQLTRIGV